VSSINRILRNRAAERAAAEFARVGGYAGIYYGGHGSHGGPQANPSALSALQNWQSAAGYPPSLLSQLAAGSGLFMPNGGLSGMPGGMSGLPSGFSGLSSGMNGSLAQSPTSREDTPHSMSPKPSPDMVRLILSCFPFKILILCSTIVQVLNQLVPKI
jgi:hypothetical protein